MLNFLENAKIENVFNNLYMHIGLSAKGVKINVKNQSSFQFYLDANPPGAKGQAEGFSKEDHLQKGF